MQCARHTCIAIAELKVIVAEPPQAGPWRISFTAPLQLDTWLLEARTSGSTDKVLSSLALLTDQIPLGIFS
jgi:hypothetical protein